MEIDPSNLGIGGVIGGILVAVAFLVSKLPKLLGGSADVVKAVPPATAITVTNTGSSAAADADGTGRHSVAPAPTASNPFAGIEGETTPERVTAVRCEELRDQLEEKLEARSDKGLERLEGKMDGMVTEQRRMNDTLVRLTTLSEEASKREERYSKRLERVERRVSAASA